MLVRGGIVLYKKYPLRLESAFTAKIIMQKHRRLSVTLQKNQNMIRVPTDSLRINFSVLDAKTKYIMFLVAHIILGRYILLLHQKKSHEYFFQRAIFCHSATVGRYLPLS